MMNAFGLTRLLLSSILIASIYGFTVSENSHETSNPSPQSLKLNKRSTRWDKLKQYDFSIFDTEEPSDETDIRDTISTEKRPFDEIASGFIGKRPFDEISSGFIGKRTSFAEPLKAHSDNDEIRSEIADAWRRILNEQDFDKDGVVSKRAPFDEIASGFIGKRPFDELGSGFIGKRVSHSGKFDKRPFDEIASGFIGKRAQSYVKTKRPFDELASGFIGKRPFDEISSGFIGKRSKSYAMSKRPFDEISSGFIGKRSKLYAKSKRPFDEIASGFIGKRQAELSGLAKRPSDELASGFIGKRAIDKLMVDILRHSNTEKRR